MTRQQNWIRTGEDMENIYARHRKDAETARGKRAGLTRLALALVCGFALLQAFDAASAPKPNPTATSSEKTDGKTQDAPKPPMIKSLTLRGIALRDFARMLSKAWGKAIAVSEKANKNVNVFLENVDCETALRIVCRANGLWYRMAEKDQVVFIETVEEYRENSRVYNEQYIETVTLLYPTVEDIGETLKDLFRDQIVWTMPNQDLNDASEKMDRALNRMDILAERGQFSLENNDGQNGGQGGSSYGSGSSSFGGRGSGGSYRSSSSGGGDLTYNENRSKAELPEELKHNGRRGESRPIPGEGNNKPGIVYVAGMAASNTIILRSSDKRSLEQVKKLIGKLDKPAPQVLLEVKILELRLADEQKRGFDVLFKSDDFSGGFSNGLIDINGTSGGNLIATPGSFLQPRGTGIDRRAAVFNYISKNVRARIQAMQLNGDLNLLSTPSLLVADNEASRIFVGTETTILTEVQVESNTTSGNNPVITYNYNPITQRRNIGTTLLITPKIHADRTVTIRVMQETSDRGATQRVVYGSNQQGGQRYFDTTDIDQRIVTTTVEAQSEQIIAIGGLIRESEEERKEGAPIAKDIPLIGHLFERVTKRKIRTELIVMIRPYILLAPGETQKTSDKFLKRVAWHKTAKDEKHPELNLKIKEDAEKKKSETGTKNPFEWLENWLDTSKDSKEKDEDRKQENLIIE